MRRPPGGLPGASRELRPLSVPVLLAVLLAAPACQRQVQVESGPPAEQEGPMGERAAPSDTVVGEVRQVGSTPFVRTVIETDTETVAVAGSLRSELSRLVGATVRAAGERTSGELPGPHLEVASYEVLEVDGERPWVGVLRRTETGWIMEETDGPATCTIRLGAVSGGLAAAEGGKVWVVTDAAGNVLRYGIIREPAPAQD